MKRAAIAIRSIVTLAMLSALVLVATHPIRPKLRLCFTTSQAAAMVPAQSRLTADGKGNFYGTTYQGGTFGPGTGI